MTGPRGPTLDTTTPKYVKHPPAASGWLPDGAPLDAGTAHLVHNNLSVLSYQNTRHLGATNGPGMVNFLTAFNAWTGIIDTSGQSGTDPYGYHPWAIGATATVFGPYSPSYTRLGTTPAGMWPRKVRVVIECEKGATSSNLILMAAIVRGQGTPLGAPVVCRTSHTLVAADNGQRIVSLILEPDYPVAPCTTWRSRPTGGGLAANTLLCPLWIWAGWFSDDPGTADNIWSISATEIAE